MEIRKVQAPISVGLESVQYMQISDTKADVWLRKNIHTETITIESEESEIVTAEEIQFEVNPGDVTESDIRNNFMKYWIINTSPENYVQESNVTSLVMCGFYDDSDADIVKEKIISWMSEICHNTITHGSDIELSDGNTYHFSFDITDQTQLNVLAQKAQNGESFLPWHSDGATCKLYSKEDILKIYGVMEQLITYQVTYFNSLRNYILSLTSVNDIIAINYGDTIPEQYCSEVLLALQEGSDSE